MARYGTVAVYESESYATKKASFYRALLSEASPLLLVLNEAEEKRSDTLLCHRNPPHYDIVDDI